MLIYHLPDFSVMAAPILLIMSLIDLVGAFVLVTLPARASIEFMTFPAPQAIAFYLGVMMAIKGLYSLFWGIVGADA